jgi:hypothetical protein
MRSGHAPGRTGKPDLLTAMDVLADLHANHGQMAVHRDQPLAMIDQYAVAVEEVIARVDHAAIGRDLHRRA